MDIQFDKYPALGFLFGFMTGLPDYLDQIIIAFLLGFVGAAGGYVFEIIKKIYSEYSEEKKKSKNNKTILMDKIRSTITKILATWVGIGTALIAIGASGIIPIPEVLVNLFSQNVADILGGVADAIITAIGAVIAAAQAIRAILIGSEQPAEGQVSSRSLENLKALRKSPFTV